MNPFRLDRLGLLASWFRGAVGWLVLGLLAKWLWDRMGAWIRGFSTVPQVIGNSVVGGTGAQATAFAAATLMTVAIVVATVALTGWAFGDINPLGLVSKLSESPLVGLPEGVFWMLNELLPVATIVSAFVARVSFNVYASSLYATCSAVVRFITP